MQIHFGLPRTRHTVQQVHAESILRDFDFNTRDRSALFLIQLGRLCDHVFSLRPIILVNMAHNAARFLLQHALFHQRVGNCRRQIETLQHQPFVLRTVLLLQKAIQLRLLWCALRQRFQILRRELLRHTEQLFFLDPRPASHRCRDHRFDYPIERRRVVNGHPAREPEQIRRESGKRMHDLRHVFETIERKIVLRLTDVTHYP